MNSVVLFDLFGTLVHFPAEVPKAEPNDERWRASLEWLDPLVSELLPEHSFQRFLEALITVTNEIVATRSPEYYEVPSAERFRRTLSRLGIHSSRCAALAPFFVEAHMTRLTERTFPDASAASVLAEIRRKGYRIGLVSNFDHAPAAYRVLEQHALSPLLDTIVISAAFGRRKPHPSIFLEALRRLGGVPERSWFVGDNYSEDVVGAQSAGLHCVWIDPKCSHPQTNDRNCNEAIIVVRSLSEVPRCIEAGTAPSGTFLLE